MEYSASTCKFISPWRPSNRYIYAHTIIIDGSGVQAPPYFDFNHKNMAFEELPLSESIIKDAYQIKYSINSSFSESTINKGVEKLKINSSFNQIKKLTPWKDSVF